MSWWKALTPLGRALYVLLLVLALALLVAGLLGGS